MTEPTAYIVAGVTGEYSDQRVWYVRAFLDKNVADRFCKRLNAWCRRRGCHDKGLFVHNTDQQHPPEDPQFRCDYNGTEYSIIKVPLETVSKIPVVER